MPQFESNELQSQMQLRDVSKKTWEISQRRLWEDFFNTSHLRRLLDLQINPLWDVSETLHETSQRCIWDGSMTAGLFISTGLSIWKNGYTSKNIYTFETKNI